jgi:uncharacterized protein (TIGR02145 family)
MKKTLFILNLALSLNFYSQEIEENCEYSRQKYLEVNQDVKNAGLDPMFHYINYGKKEGRKWPPCERADHSGTNPIAPTIDYKSVNIGSQIWMIENLNVTTFSNGDPIPEAKTKEEWDKAGVEGRPAWCYYKNNEENGKKFGKLYNWYAANDSRGLAPIGWHIPSDKEWDKLVEYLKENQGLKMKSAINWDEFGDKNELNISGFMGLPGGIRDCDGSFDILRGEGLFFFGMNIIGCWWSNNRLSPSEELNLPFGSYRGLSVRSNDLLQSTYLKSVGLSVRCVKNI